MKNLDTKEDKTTLAIEEQTRKIPSDAFLFTSMGAITVSLILKVMGRRADAIFVGQWVAPILLLGIYNKLVKENDEDKHS